MRRMLPILLLSLLPVGLAAAAKAAGRVYLDRNGNGTQDASEPGVAGIKLSNGRDLALSGRDGRYRLALRDGDTLFLIKPPDHALPRGAGGLPRFWRHHFPHGSPKLRYGGIQAQSAAHADFALLPGDAAGRQGLEVLVFGDPQPKTLAEVDYYARDIVEPILGKHPARLGLSLGDIVHDDLSLYPAVNRVTARLGLPWLHAAGNHDLDLDAQRDADSLLGFRNVFGPDTFAWEEPEASFIVFDDVIPRRGQAPAYIGGLRADQFAFLQAYLPTLPKARRLIVAAHIPFFDPQPGHESFRRADRERLFALLKDFPQVLLLSAHGHVQRHYFHGPADGWRGAGALHEYNAGAACGGFWGGAADAAGIPEAGMADGTPNGYATLRIAAAGDYALRWHVARAPDDYAIALHVPKVLRRGAWAGVPAIANVFMGIAGDRVQARIDDGPWRPMNWTAQADPRALAENLADDAVESLRGGDRAPQAEVSTHLWSMNLPTDLPAGEHRIEVRAFDRWRGELRASTRYRLVEAQP